MNVDKLNELISVALPAAKHGIVTNELKELQKVIWRNYVNWTVWPRWCQPSNNEDYECHEG